MLFQERLVFWKYSDPAKFLRGRESITPTRIIKVQNFEKDENRFHRSISMIKKFHLCVPEMMSNRWTLKELSVF